MNSKPKLNSLKLTTFSHPIAESVFAPSADMDLDDGEIDDDERELEAFKRFCFNSVPAKQKAKISLDLNTLKRK